MDYKNKHGITISKDVMIEYHNRLINMIYKALTIFEGRDFKTKEVIMSKEDSLCEFQIYTNNMLYEVSGCKHLFIENKEFIRLLVLLVELHTKKEHKDVKNIVFTAINIVEDMKGVLSNGV